MESFEDVQQQEFAHLTGEIGMLGRRLVELGWGRDQVLAYVKDLLNEPTDTATASGVPHASRKEDRP
jgi:hypothetical protein